MAFITITKNNQTKRVSKKSFEDYFKNAGWIEAGNNPASSNSQEAQEEPSNKKVINNKEKDKVVIPEAPGDSEKDEWDEVLENEEEEDEEIHKPIAEMNREELIKFAKDNNISLAGLTKNNQFKEAIRAALKDKEA